MRSRTGGLCCVKFHVGKLPNGTLDVRIRHTCCLIRTHAARLHVPPARTKIAWPRNVAMHNRIIDSLRGAIVPRQPRKERAPTYAATVSGSPPSPTTTAELPTPTAAAAAAASAAPDAYFCIFLLSPPRKLRCHLRQCTSQSRISRIDHVHNVYPSISIYLWKYQVQIQITLCNLAIQATETNKFYLFQ